MRVIPSPFVERPPASLLALALLLSCASTRGRPTVGVASCPPVFAPSAAAPPAPAAEEPVEVAPIATGGRRAQSPPDCGAPDAYCSEAHRLGIYQELLDAVAAQVLLAAPRPRSTRTYADWDRRTITPGMRAVGDEVGLTGREWAAIARNGFTVLRRARYTSPYESYKDIYRMQLPLFVSADSILHAVFRGHEKVLERLEPRLQSTVVTALGRLRTTLPTMRAELPDEAVRDLDVYLSVALALATDEAPTTLSPELSDEATRLVNAVHEASEIDDHATLFGRVRVMDYTAFAPRGPYAESEQRQPWFRAAHWLSRVEFNVVSRDCRSSQPGVSPNPEETPREALAAFALAAVAARADALAPLESVSAAWRAIAGRREDMGLADLERVRRESGVTSLRDRDTFARLSAAIGNGFARTARTHPMPEGVGRLPVIATMLGVSVVPDAAMTRPLVHDEIEHRFRLGAADVAFAMGHEPAGRLLAEDLARFPALRAGYGRAREALRRAGEGDDLYSAWLSSLVTLSSPARGAVPSFMRTAAWGDLRTNTLAVGYGQLRHGNVLYASTSYDGAACRIPDAWVEPVPELFSSLRVYYRRLGELVARLSPSGADTGVGAWIDAVDRNLRVLERIARDELAGHALTEAQRRFLGYVAEVLPSSEGEPTHTGWYVEMFPNDADAMESSHFIADYYASTNAQEVSYVGSAGTVLGAFVVDRGGSPRLMVGPVADGFEHHGPLARRLDDRGARRLPASERSAPWATSYALDPVATPRFAFAERGEEEGERPAALAGRLRVEGAATPGVLVVEYLSRHHRVLARGSATVGARATPLLVRWLSGMAPRRPAESDEEETERPANDEHEVCGVRLRHGSWVETRSTDEYPFSDGCEEPELAGSHFGGAPRARTVGDENSDEEPAPEAGSDGSE